MQSPRDFILSFHADRNYTRFVDELLADSTLTEGVLQLLYEENYPFPEYSSWLFAHVSKRKPKELNPFHSRLIDVILQTNNHSVQRNLLGMLLDLPLIEHREGELLDFCFRELVSSESKVALKAYSMYMIVRFLKNYPELKTELESAIDIVAQQPQTPAFYGAARKVRKQLQAIK